MKRERPLTDEERKFYDSFVDCTPDPQKRSNRDSMVRGALRELGKSFAGALGQDVGIRERTADDDRIRAVIHRARELLESIATPEPVRSAPRRSRRP